ncbi:glycerate kinase, partial [Pseudomonas syringae pv. actinidiae ICMP 18804]
MKIVIAPDSFKDSLSAQAVADAIASGLAEV